MSVANNHNPSLSSQVSIDSLCTPAISILPTFFRTSEFDTTFFNYSMNLSVSPVNLRMIVFFMLWLQLYFIYTGKLPEFVLYKEKGSC